MELKRFAWIAQNEDVDADGFYTNDHEAERRALAEMGAPETELIQFISILPEDRDEAMAEALVTEAFRTWATSAADGSGRTVEAACNDANLIWYE